MYEGYLQINGTEVVSAARATAYIKRFMPRMQFKCDEAAIAAIAAGAHGSLLTPSTGDVAPWFDAGIPESADFYGFYPARVDGGSDSSFTTPETELVGDGGVFGLPRTGSLETRWTVVGFAKDAAAMEAGLTWLKEVLTSRTPSHECDPVTLMTLKAPPRSTFNFYEMLRTYYNVGVTVAPAVSERKRTPSGIAWTITFTLKAGIPWGFATWADIGSLDMNSGYATFSDPAGQNCSVQNLAYKDFINDPFYTAISLPPQPPVIKPPVLLPVPVWRRKSLPLTVNLPARVRKQRTEIEVTISAGSAVRQMRLRIYLSGASMNGCDYTGEFYISYIPAGSTMTINTATRQAMVTLASGAQTTGSHLLFGSDGNPFLWPDFLPNENYTLVCDLMPAFDGVNTNVQLYVTGTSKD